MQLPGLKLLRTPLFNFSSSVTTGGTAQSVVPIQSTRSYLLVENTSASNLRTGIGGATATAALTGGGVSSVSVNNAGQGYTYAPQVFFLGGLGLTGVSGSVAGGAGFEAPSDPNKAAAHCVMTGSAGNLSIASVVVDNAGAGYLAAPYVWFENDPRDPYGGFSPSATAGELLQPGGSLVMDGSSCSSDQIFIFGASTGQTFVCRVVLG